MPDPIEPNAHRVQIASTHVSTEAAAVYRKLVAENGGSAERAIDTALLNAAGIQVGFPPRVRHKILSLRKRLEKVLVANDERAGEIESDLETLATHLDIARDQISDALDSLDKVSKQVEATRRRLAHPVALKPTNRTAAALDELESTIHEYGIVGPAD